MTSNRSGGLQLILTYILENPAECPASRVLFDKLLALHSNMEQYAICQILYGQPVEEVASDCEQTLGEVQEVFSRFENQMKVCLNQTRDELMASEGLAAFIIRYGPADHDDEAVARTIVHDFIAVMARGCPHIGDVDDLPHSKNSISNAFGCHISNLQRKNGDRNEIEQLKALWARLEDWYVIEPEDKDLVKKLNHTSGMLPDWSWELFAKYRCPPVPPPLE